ncbi:MAG: hypothetical protein Q4E17_05770 [Synergistes sp.]|nr:hypothetical protein [Synergistes sp.]
MKDKCGENKTDFHCVFGTWPFKKTFDITASGFQFCGEMFPLNTITRLRWGTEQNTGKIFRLLRYTASFGTETREIVMHIKEKKLYETVTAGMWDAVGKRLLAVMSAGLKNGKSYKFGAFSVNDRGINVTKDENTKSYRWNELKWAIVNENLVFMPIEYKDRLVASAPLVSVDNAHILSIALALFQKDRRDTTECLSDAIL